MKLLSNGLAYCGRFDKIFDNKGAEVLAPLLSIIPSSTIINITKVSKDTFSIDIPDISNKLLLGETVNFVRADFDVKATIIEIGHNNYRVKRLYDDISYDYDDDKDIIIEDGVTELRRNCDILLPINMEDGEYYSNFGEYLLIGDYFKAVDEISVDSLYTMKPSLRGKGIEEWELNRMLQLAYDFVMEDLQGYEFNDIDRFKYININGITKLILYRTISIYESSFPNENGEYAYIYGKKYKGALNGFRPYKKIGDNGEILEAKKKGLRY